MPVHFQTTCTLIKFFAERCVEVKDDGIVVSHDDKLEEIKADSVVLALGFRASNPLKEENVHVIGAAKQAKTIMSAIWEGYELSNTL